MEITVQYLAGCPNVETVSERLMLLGVSLHMVRMVEITSPEQAERVGFPGSPTILVDGEDRFVGASSPAGFACRVYRTESGLEGAPSVEQLRAVLEP